MLTVVSIPNSDSQLLSCIALCKMFRRRGHRTVISIEPANMLSELMHQIAAQENEEIFPFERINEVHPDVILFDSNQLVPEPFTDVFRFDLLAGVFWHEKESITHLHLFANSNLACSPNRIQREFPNIYQGVIPVLGIPAVRLYSRAGMVKKRILFPDGFPMLYDSRKQMYKFFVQLASAYPDYEICIKRRFPENVFAHNPFQSYFDFFDNETPENIKLIDYSENTRKWVDSAEIIIGVESGILFEAAFIGKKVCLIADSPYEIYNGIVRNDDVFACRGVRALRAEILKDIDAASRFSRDIINEFLPSEYGPEMIVDMIETIFHAFPEKELRNACKFDIPVSMSYDKDIEKFKNTRGEFWEESHRNRIRMLYYAFIAEIAKMFILVAPDTSENMMNDFLEKNDFIDELPLNLNEAKGFIESKRGEMLSLLVKEFFSRSSMETIFSCNSYVECDILSLGFQLADYMPPQIGHEFIANLQKSIERIEKISTSRYNMASTFERLGMLSKAKEIFTSILHEDNEIYVKYGAYFHLGRIYRLEGNIQKSREYLEHCLCIEPNHRQARQILEEISLARNC